MLWLGLHLPALSLESFAATLGPQADTQPLALIAQQRLVAVNAVARAQGVVPGMTRATALALLPGLTLGAADAARDARALSAVVHTLLAFTPVVVPLPPQGVLAELQPSLRCFGGPVALWAQIEAALAGLGHALQWAPAPGARAAQWLSQWRPDPASPVHQTRAVLAPGGRPGLSTDPAWAETQQRLAGLPVACALPGRAAQEAAQAMGLATLGELLRQPRAGLSRRFGPELLQVLDQAWGHAPDPREPVRPQPVFADRVDLLARTDHTDLLLSGAAVLLARLAAWARAHQARVQRFVLSLHHETRLRASSLGEAGAHVSTLTVALAEPSADPAHWQAVLRERLQREPLAASVLGLSLSCDTPVFAPPPDTELFPAAAGAREGLLRLLERLQARLGDDGVQGLAQQSDHRPEQASSVQPALAPGARASPAAALPRLTRPVWLLASPQPLVERQSRPWLAGQPLRLLAGPERIEVGWWDGALVARDYFIAQSPDSVLVWVYRLRPAPPQGEPGWFLHGRFG